MATLTGTRPQNTYQGLLKILDSDALEASLQQVSDGFGNTSPLFISTSQVAILGASGGRAVFNAALLDADRTFTFQNQSGTIAHFENCVNSIVGDAGLNQIRLVGDASTLAPRLYYGTNNLGVRGFATVNSLLNFWQEGATVFSTRTINTWTAIGSPTDISVVILPKGNGAFALAVADGTNVGGNVRGNFAVDLQRTRSVNTQVASGIDSFVANANSTASGTSSSAFGSAIASNSQCFAAVGGIASGTRSVSFRGTSSGVESFTANSTNNTASGLKSTCFGEHGDISGESSFGVGTFARSVVKNAFIIGGGQASNVTSQVTTSLQWSLFGAVAGTPYQLKNIAGDNLILDHASSATQTRFLRFSIAASAAGSPKGSWIREILVTIDVNNTTYNIVNVHILHSYEDNNLVGATVSFTTINGNPGQVVVSFTPATSVSTSVRCFVSTFGVFSLSS